MEGLSDAQRKAAGEPFQFIIGVCVRHAELLKQTSSPVK